jgi:hypothetical protein
MNELIFLPVSIVFAIAAFRGLMTGRTKLGHAPVERGAQPVLYWGLIILDVAILAVSVTKRLKNV